MIRVLCVDDDSDQLELTKHFLERNKNISVTTRNDPHDALHLLEAGGFDAVISDYQMPEMDGLQFLRALRTRGDDIVFIIFTGKGREDVAVQAYDGGADGYVQKGTDIRSMFAELAKRMASNVERKEAMRDLKNNEKKFRLITDNIIDAIWLTDLDFKCLWISPSVEHQRGYTMEELNQLAFDKSNTSTSYQKLRQDIKSMIENERADDPSAVLSLDLEVEFYRKDGSTFWCDTRITLLRDDKGAPNGFLAVGRDITDRKLMELEKEARQKKLDSLYSAGPIGMGFVKDRVYQEVNDHFLELTGYTKGEIIGKCTRVVYPDDKEYERVGKIKYEQVRREGTGSVETRMVRKDGKIIDVLLSSSGIKPYTTEEGVCFFAIDITERVNMTERLQQDHLNLQKAMGDLDQFFRLNLDLLSISDMKGVFVRLNPEWERTFGYRIEDLVGKKFLDFVHPDDMAATKEQMNAISEGKDVVNFVNRYRRKDGTYRYLEWRSAAYQGGLAFSAARDITDRIMMEDSLRLANIRLNLLTQITRHDLKNQLFILMGKLNMLPDMRPEDMPAHIDMMNRRATAMARVIDSTKEYQDLGTKEPTWLSWRRLIEESMAELHADGINLELRGQDVEIYADPIIKKAFYNLLDNAQRYAGEHAHVICEAKLMPDGLHILVSDDGPGIPDDIRNKLFEPGQSNGHGLGLFLSKEILSITGLSISERGEKGHGALFDIHVPTGAFHIRAQ